MPELKLCKCKEISCDHNTGFTEECMYGISEELIERAKSDKPMCDILRNEVIKDVNL